LVWAIATAGMASMDSASTLRLRNFMSFSLICGNDNEHSHGRFPELDTLTGAIRAYETKEGRLREGIVTRPA
jgi:hypothetical protein